MRRFLTFVVVLVFTSLHVGCGSENKPPPVAKDPIPKKEKPGSSERFD
jgi:hypothetical protein